MKTKILNTNWFLDADMSDGTVTFESKRGKPIDAFSFAQDFVVDEEVEIEIDGLDCDLEWDEIFKGNPDKEQKLIKLDDWKYDGFGKIVSIDPIVIDFGELEMEVGNWSNDPSIVGEFVRWKIERLEVFKK